MPAPRIAPASRTRRRRSRPPACRRRRPTRPRDEPASAAPGSASVAEVATRGGVLRRLELEVLRRLDGIAQRRPPRPALGPGSERAGAREYAPGDDARLIDWNLTARSAATYVRTHRGRPRGRDLDRRRPLGQPRLRHRTREKRDVVLGAAAAFGMLTVRGHNRLGAPRRAAPTAARTDPPTTRPRRLMAALARDLRHPAAGRPPRGRRRPRAPRCAGCWSPQRRRSQVVVVSDFLGGDAVAAAAAAARRSATRSSPCTSPTRASWSCPPSASSPSSTPRPGASATCRPRRARCAARYATRPPSGTPTSARDHAARRRVPRTCRRRATGSPTRCCSRPAAAALRRTAAVQRMRTPAPPRPPARSPTRIGTSTMTFLSAWRLVLLVAPLALLVAYVLVQRRRHTPGRCASPASTSSTPSRPSGPAGSGTSPPPPRCVSLVVLTLAFAQPAMALRDPARSARRSCSPSTPPASMAATDVSPEPAGGRRGAGHERS